MVDCTLQGVFTDIGRAALAKSFLGPLKRPLYAESYAKYFKIGVRGYQLGPGGTKQPKTPDPSLSDIESVTLGAYYFTKDFTVDDLDINIDGSITYAKITAFLDYSEGDDDGTGNSPEFFEVGIFDDQDVMLIYATMPGETKNASKTLNHIINVNF